jgi:hypothetical protein
MRQTPSPCLGCKARTGGAWTRSGWHVGLSLLGAKAGGFLSSQTEYVPDRLDGFFATALSASSARRLIRVRIVRFVPAPALKIRLGDGCRGRSVRQSLRSD